MCFHPLLLLFFFRAKHSKPVHSTCFCLPVFLLLSLCVDRHVSSYTCWVFVYARSFVCFRLPLRHRVLSPPPTPPAQRHLQAGLRRSVGEISFFTSIKHLGLGKQEIEKEARLTSRFSSSSCFYGHLHHTPSTRVSQSLYLSGFLSLRLGHSKVLSVRVDLLSALLPPCSTPRPSALSSSRCREICMHAPTDI